MGFGGKKPEPPKPPPPPPTMGDEDIQAAKRAMADRLRKRRGRASTILTSSQGALGGRSILGS